MEIKFILLLLLNSFVNISLGYYNEYGFNNGQFSEDARQLYELYDGLNGLRSFKEVTFIQHLLYKFNLLEKTKFFTSIVTHFKQVNSPDVQEENGPQRTGFEDLISNQSDEDEEPSETVDKNQISETIEEDQEIRRIDDSKNDQKNSKFQSKDIETGQYSW